LIRSAQNWETTTHASRTSPMRIAACRCEERCGWHYARACLGAGAYGGTRRRAQRKPLRQSLRRDLKMIAPTRAGGLGCNTLSVEGKWYGARNWPTATVVPAWLIELLKPLRSAGGWQVARTSAGADGENRSTDARTPYQGIRASCTGTDHCAGSGRLKRFQQSARGGSLTWGCVRGEHSSGKDTSKGV